MGPDICTSLSCNTPSDYCYRCSHAIYKGFGTDANGKMWLFSFSPQFGPQVIKADNDTPSKRQPMNFRSPFWNVFEAWQFKRKYRWMWE